MGGNVGELRGRFVDVAVISKLSLLAYFVDVKTAFAAMLWALAIPLRTSDMAFLQRLTALGFTKSEVADIFP